MVAPSPNDKGLLVRLYANPNTLRAFLDDRMNAKLGEYCGLVHGNVLESTPDGSVEGGTNGLLDSVALFRGIQRPMVGAGLDKDVYVYVTNPLNSYIYPLSERLTDAGPTRVPRPNSSVFVTYVELGQRASGQLAGWAIDSPKCAGLDGVIHGWEWVLSSPDDARLPDRYQTRYQDWIW